MTDEEQVIWAQAYAAGYDTGHHAGYQQRINDEEDAYRNATPVRVLGTWYNQAEEREKCDAETRALLAARDAA